jgi:hypothetical protein
MKCFVLNWSETVRARVPRPTRLAISKSIENTMRDALGSAAAAWARRHDQWSAARGHACG